MHRIWKTLLTASLLLAASSCKSGPMPRWDAKFYAADSVSESVIHKHKAPDGTPVEDDRIHANEPRFNDGIWLSYSDLKRNYEIMLSCKEWRKETPLMSETEQLDLWKMLGGPAK
jgi:hypothetical protein